MPGNRHSYRDLLSLVLLGTLGLATGLVRAPGFWSSYVLDIVGPAWNYILIRGLYTEEQPTAFSRFFSPEITLVLIISLCFLIELGQYFRLYEAHYDPYDFIAYVALLLPTYIVDKWHHRLRSTRATVE